MSSSKKLSNLQLIESTIGLYRGWYAFARKHRPEALTYWILVDDLAQVKTSIPSFDTWTAIESAFLEKIEQWQAQENSSDAVSNKTAFTIGKLKQSLLFLLDTESARGKATGLDLDEQSIRDRGSPWVAVGTAELQATKRRFLELKQVADSSLSSRAIESNAYFNEHLTSEKAAKLLFSAGIDFLQVFKTIIPGLIQPNFGCVPLSMNLPFQNLVTYSEGIIRVLLNRNMERAFTPAHINFLALHEICGHVSHFAYLMANAKVQKNYPHLVCLTMHTQDAFVLEGVAQIMSALLLPEVEKTRPELAAQFANADLFVKVRHHNIMNLVKGNSSFKEAADLHCEMLGGNAHELADMYKARMEKSYNVVQVLNYYASFHSLEKFLCFSREKQIALFERLLTDFPCPDHADAWIVGLEESSH